MAPTERPFLASPFAGARGVIIAPFQFETTEDDNLRIESANALVGVVIAIQGRRRTADGSIEPFTFVHTPNTDRSVKTQDYKLGAGALLNLTIFASSGSPKRGQTFVTARFIRGLTGATIVLGTLLQGYVTASHHLAYPGSPIESSTEGTGYSRTVNGTTPSAGSEVTETVPTGARWRLVTFRTTLSTDATVANRRSGLFFTDGSLTLYRSPQPVVIAASLAIDNYWSEGSPFDTGPLTDVSVANLPFDNRLLPGYQIKTATNQLKAGDAYGNVRYQVNEWLEV